MRLVSIAVVVLFVMSGVSSSADKDEFVGTWTLEASEARAADGSWKPVAGPMGRQPIGRIMYDSAGNMSVQAMGSDRTRLPSGGLDEATAEQLASTLRSYIAYFGKYEVNEEEGTVTHHRESSLLPNQAGTAVERSYVLEGDTLMLMPSPDSRTRWKRVN